jgi:imidazolonepropionase-like amidohydrolase
MLICLAKEWRRTKLYSEAVSFEVVDLEGATVLPGFIDAHAHLFALGESRLRPDITGLSTVEEIRTALESWVVTNNVAPGSVDDGILVQVTFRPFGTWTRCHCSANIGFGSGASMDTRAGQTGLHCKLWECYLVRTPMAA